MYMCEYVSRLTAFLKRCKYVCMCVCMCMNMYCVSLPLLRDASMRVCMCVYVYEFVLRLAASLQGCRYVYVYEFVYMYVWCVRVRICIASHCLS